ncbi:sensor domain-containing diguanylate cyclase [Jatrophihabitans telluris]|uniref:Sensor domain-containing diguanylate cyclase n=1 Tax=Jatrophihabitans telluris TaxID=2038343 RepID=A0ABY4QTQ4_9ACTN|nr:sensor domain-containing diguanylate cyclase [Jatrophihabitans telluris]UQX86843.1 sensor domain-containing diguanylate cyclase [Jatrophihabitans telluris]
MGGASLDVGRQQQLLAGLAALARETSTATIFEDVLETSAERILDGIGASTVSLSRLEPGTGTLRTLINVGDLGPSEQRWPTDEVYTLQNFLKLRGVVSDHHTWTATIEDPDSDPAELALLAELGKQAAIATPILVEGRMWGELYLTFADLHDLLPAQAEDFLQVYLAVVEGALTRLRQIQTLEQLAYRDPMTGLANRRALDDAAQRAFTSLGEGGITRVNVAAFDLNGLKRVNDRHGHARGDEFILGAATAIQANFNRLAGNLAARVGGDEFIVLVPEHDLDSVSASACSAVDEIGRLGVGFGASCGLATATSAAHQRSASELFAQADVALYESKRRGELVVAA